MESFHQTLSFLEEHNADYQERVRVHLDAGFSYPKATSMAFLDLNPEGELVDLSKPNNILGFQYLKSARRQYSSMELFTVARKSAGYHDEQFTSDSIASATSIRKALFQGMERLNAFANMFRKLHIKVYFTIKKSLADFINGNNTGLS